MPENTGHAMTVAEVRGRKKVLDEKILALIREFEKQTGLNVEGIQTKIESVIGTTGTGYMIIAVDTEVKI